MTADSSESYALEQDRQDSSNCFREHFVIPSKGDLRRKTLARDHPESKASEEDDGESCIYMCGNSLGLQPRLTRKYFEQYLETWATKGVFGHFTELNDSNLVPWLHVDDDVQEDMAKLVGAKGPEVAVMQTLTANLHLMMASFYKPTKQRYKVILEAKAFPSDHYAIESQIQHHGFEPSEAAVLIRPPSKDSETIPTDHILKVIDQHADETALLLLPGIQFYTGQLFDIRRITAHAQSKGILVGWDLAHAAGNVALELHDWNVDFAVWCTYKYLNCGPGSIGACFVNERHFHRPRLAGWWGSSKSSRFDMTNVFQPIASASGFQLSNPSVADTTALRASLDVFKQTDIAALRQRSLRLTGHLEALLEGCEARKHFAVITPRDPSQRGAQLSLRLKPGLLEGVLARLEEAGVVVDERRPDVIRVAPAPLYNTMHDVWRFVQVFNDACRVASEAREKLGSSVMATGGATDRGWSEIK